MATPVETARYIFADLSNNNNKYWNGTLFDDGNWTAEWGRVGESPASGTWSGAAKFAAKCREKEKKGYVRQQVLESVATVSNNRPQMVTGKEELSRIALAQVDTNNDIVKSLLRRLAQANVHSILAQTTLKYDESKGTFSTPLGIVTSGAIMDARAELNLIASLVTAQDFENRQLMQAINKFLMLVPQDIGRNRVTAQRLFPSMSVVQEKNDLLDALEASLISVLSVPKKADEGSTDDSASASDPKVFDLKLHLIEDGKEIDRIRTKYNATRHKNHASSSLEVKCAYTVELGLMRQDFEDKGKLLGNIQEYWHGTRIHNVLSILKSGLQVSPPTTASIAGKMFGFGIYTSCQATKSLNYAIGVAPGQSGGWDGDSTFMFLADVAMGKTHFAKSSYEHTWPAPHTDSTSAIAGKCSGLINNEYIVYRNHQINLTRLVEFTKGGR